VALLLGCDPVDTIGHPVAGIVLAGPTCPVERIESPCPDQPVSMDLEIRNERGAVVERVRSDREGRFGLRLAPGRYTVHGPQMLPSLQMTEFIVRAGQTTRLQLRADTGIR
jgi:hypothetical protein